MNMANVHNESMESGFIHTIKTFFGYIVLFGMVLAVTVSNFVKEIFMPIYRIAFSKRHPVFVRTPEDRFIKAWLDKLGYRFTSKYLELPLGSGANDNLPR